MTDLKTLKDFDKYKIIDGKHPEGIEGFQKVYRFPNGFGASVVRFKLGSPFVQRYGSYTDDETEVELAVLKFHGEGDRDADICYSTPITDDVIGHLKEPELIDVLNQIINLTEADLK